MKSFYSLIFLITVVVAFSLACGGSNNNSENESPVNIQTSKNVTTVQDEVGESTTISIPEGNVVFSENVSIPEEVLVVVEANVFQISGNLNLNGELQIK